LPTSRRTVSATSRRIASAGDDVPEARLSSSRASKRYSTQSVHDVADRHLREKTDAIADIIRNISEQCAAAVEGLQLANEAADIARMSEAETEDMTSNGNLSADERPASSQSRGASQSRGHVTPTSDRSSVPPTPELVHQRSSTALSMVSTAPTNYTARESLRDAGSRTKIVDGDSVSVYSSQESPLTSGEPLYKKSSASSSISSNGRSPLGRVAEV